MPKALGLHINDFYNNHFPEGGEHDDFELPEEYFDNSGNLNLSPDEKYELNDFGVIVLGDTVKSFNSFYQKWFKSQTKATILIQVDLTDKDNTMAHLKELGYKVIGS
jgi:hypothetical protein